MIVTCMVALTIGGNMAVKKLTGHYLNQSEVVCSLRGECREYHAVDFTKSLTKMGLFGKIRGVQWVNFNSCLIRKEEK